ncbi:MAG: IreB family regulatory phosphoprotein [Bacillota bacterium]
MKGPFDETQTFRVVPEDVVSVRALLLEVYQALKEKGYNPTNQIVGYLMSGDPTYITSHRGARNLIRKLERDEIIEELVRYYLEGR